MSVFSDVKHLRDHVGAIVTVRGWVQTTRAHGKVAFVVMRDGTGIVQCVLVQKQVPPEVWSRFEHLHQETSVFVTGSVRADARAPGGHELTVEDLTIFGESIDYPI